MTDQDDAVLRRKVMAAYVAEGIHTLRYRGLHLSKYTDHELSMLKECLELILRIRGRVEGGVA